MKKRIHLRIVNSLAVFISILMMTSVILARTEIPAGNVSGLWVKAYSPYQINGEITIPNDSTLTIEPGVDVIFTGHYKFNVQGRLLAVGTEQDTITFTAQDPLVGWHSLRFINTPSNNDSSKVVYCSLKYGKANSGNDLDRCGGAIAIKYFSKVLITNCLIAYNTNSGNIATTGGGGIALWTASPTITDCEFKANTSVYGSAMAIYYSSNALICNNHFHGHTGHGLINIGASSAPILINNLIENNTSTPPAHGIIHFEGGSGRAILINNTIVNNDCGGGAIWENDGSKPLFINNIIFGNEPAQVMLEVPSGLNFFNCLIEGGTAGFTGSDFSGAYQNCLDSIPIFVSSTDLRLQDSSPCIGSGVDSIQVSSKWYYAPISDFEGNPRPNPVDSHPDIGAFENALGNPASGINEMQEQIPNSIQLFQNYPNPFNPATVIRFEIDRETYVRILVFDLTGRMIRSLIDETRKPGQHRVIFDASGLASGIYFYQITTGDFSAVRKMAVID